MFKIKWIAIVSLFFLAFAFNAFAKKPAFIKKVDRKIHKFSLTEDAKKEILKELRHHILSYAHLERKAALYGLPENLYYKLSDDSLAKLEDKDFFRYIQTEFAKQRDSHTRFYYPDYMGCRKVSVPIKFRFFRDSKREDSWGKIIVYEIGNTSVFKGVSVGDELVQYENFEMKPFFKAMRKRLAQSTRGFNETVAAHFLGEIDGRYLPMPKRDRVYMLFRDYRTGVFKELEVKWDFDYSACSKIPLFKGINIPRKKDEGKRTFNLSSDKYLFSKIDNPDGVTEKLFIAGTFKRRNLRNARTYGYIKLFNFATYENKEKRETINEFMDKTLISLASLLNIFSDKHVRGIVIDTRMNPGGWIELAHHIARVFTKDKIRPVAMQFANGEESLKNLVSEVNDTEREIDRIKKNDIWSGFPYTRKYFNWDNYKSEIEKSRGLSLRLAKALPHFKEPVEGLNPLKREDDIPKVVLTDQYCVSSCDMFVAMFKENGIGKVIGEKTRGAGGMVHDGEIEVVGRWAGKKKYSAKVPFRYAYTNVLTPNREIIEDEGVPPDIYYRSDLRKFRAGELDSGWLDKAVVAFRK